MDRSETTATWLEDFSPLIYQPMLRLADSRDSGFLNQRSGSEAAVHYRRMQRRMLREYLRELSRDFHRLHSISAESAVAIIEKKLQFIFSIWNIEIRLFLDRFSPCAVNPKPLLDSVDELAAKARQVHALYKPKAGITYV